MKKLLLATALCIAGCVAPDQGSDVVATGAAIDPAHNSRNSLDWPGVYTGTVPCADCEGIATTIRLNAEGSYERELLYLGKSDTPTRDTGMFSWDDSGSIVTLQPTQGEVQLYQVGENRLFHLDRTGNRISGDLSARYVLMRAQRDPRIEDRKWLLIEVMGRPVQLTADGRRAHILLQGDAARVSGNGSCNNFFGAYVLEPGNRIRFARNMGATMMACPDMQVEDAFMDALRKVDNYAVDSGQLSLNRARMAPLLRFELAAD